MGNPLSRRAGPESFSGHSTIRNRFLRIASGRSGGGLSNIRFVMAAWHRTSYFAGRR